MNTNNVVRPKLFAFFLSELKTIRIVCRNPGCGVIVEQSMDDLIKGNGNQLRCSFCGQDFDPSKVPPAPIQALATVLNAFRNIQQTVDVEFVLPDDGKEANA
jgi:hypothetical protein